MRSKTIIILMHKNTKRFLVNRYAVYYFALRWEEMGFKVKYVFGTDNKVEADICISYIDLSVVPQAYIDYVANYKISLNAHISDVRKSTLFGEWRGRLRNKSGSVIVKSDLNHGGWPEFYLQHNTLQVVASKLLDKAGIRSKHFVGQKGYQCFDDMSVVPESILNNKNYYIEEFRPQKFGDLYGVNFYKFFGSKFESSALCSKDPIIINSNVTKRIEVEPHPDLYKVIKKYKLDFGKIDYCINDGELHVIDINKSPGRPPGKLTSLQRESLANRAEGILEFV
jgi:hypothetical protein